MQGKIDTTFIAAQRDLFTSGMAAQIGMNAYGVWHAIKYHADYADGEAWPGMRRLADLTGLSLGSVQKSIESLIESRLLRVLEEGKGKRSARYIARERMDIRIGERVICTIVVDYVPLVIQEKLKEIKAAIESGKSNPDAFADVDIIPGRGFVWDANSGMLKASIPASDIPPQLPDTEQNKMLTDLQRRALALRDQSKAKLLPPKNEHKLQA